MPISHISDVPFVSLLLSFGAGSTKFSHIVVTMALFARAGKHSQTDKSIGFALTRYCEQVGFTPNSSKDHIVAHRHPASPHTP
jgi:hypothetical protein